MTIFRPTLGNFGINPDLGLRVTHPKHMASGLEDILGQGGRLAETGRRIGADSVIRSGTFGEAMLQALDQVSNYQQVASDTHQAALLNPDTINVEDVTMAQAQASISLNITRNVLNRLVQGWRDVINTR